MELESYIRNIPDFPKPGIGFKDITTLLKDSLAFKTAVMEMCDPFRETEVDKIIGIESRGFIFGSAMAIELGVGFIPVRKPGKLPGETIREEYALEYGTDVIEMHKDSLQQNEKVIIADDLLATGGTTAATVNLVRKLGGDILAAVFLIELSFINGRKRFNDIPVYSLIKYDSE